eukprot:scaffold496687_cov38-Prasinocladus_malaysianus.AAC.1
MASRGNHSHVIDMLLERGAEVDHQTKFGDTALLKVRLWSLRPQARRLTAFLSSEAVYGLASWWIVVRK